MRKHLFTIITLCLIYILTIVWLRHIPKEVQEYADSKIASAQTEMQEKYKQLELAQKKTKEALREDMIKCANDIFELLKNEEWLYLATHVIGPEKEKDKEKEKIKKKYVKNFIRLIRLVESYEKYQQTWSNIATEPAIFKTQTGREVNSNVLEQWKKLYEINQDPEKPNEKIFDPTHLVFEYDSQEYSSIRKKLLISMVNFTYKNCVFSNTYSDETIWEKFLIKLRAMWGRTDFSQPSSEEEAKKKYNELMKLLEPLF